MQFNWENGHYSLTRIKCHSKKDEEGVYCLQYDDKKIVSGHEDSTIKVCVYAECMCYCVDVYIIMYRIIYAFIWVSVNGCMLCVYSILTMWLLKVVDTR